MKFTIRELFRAFKLSVMYFPYNEDTHRSMIRTFAVINMMDDINSETLGRYFVNRNEDFFFSHKWAELKYNPSEFVFEPPYLLLWEPDQSMSVGDPFYTNRSQTDYLIQMFILDRFEFGDPGPDYEYDPDDFRSVTELYLEAERKMRIVFDFLANEVVYGTLEGGLETVWTEGLLQEYSTALGKTYEINEEKSERWKIMLKDENPEIQVSRWSGGANDLHGIRLNLNMSQICSDGVIWDYGRNVPGYEVPDSGEGPYPGVLVLGDFDGSPLGDFDGGVMGENTH